MPGAESAARDADGGAARRATIDGAGVLRALRGGADALAVQRDALNAINVFPVPDGDTGTNMSLTMRAAVDAAVVSAGATAAGVLRAAAAGALMGARGNSGVILSQILEGLAAVDGDPAAIDGAMLAAAFERARAEAYGVVSQPREGTILTAITASAAAAAAAAAAGGAEAVLAAAARAAQEAADRTPELLPVLREAGVVDAGAEGLAVMLDGMLRGLRGASASPSLDFGAIDPSWLSATRRVHDAGDRAGSCTEFVIEGEGIDVAVLRAWLSGRGDSLLVVGGAGAVRVHVHTREPEAVLAHARRLGAVSHEKVEDMEAQFQALAAPAGEGAAAGGARAALAVVAVGAGAGIERLLLSLGAAAVVQGGQTMNPSAGEIAEAVRAAGGQRTVILPNNGNIVLAAEQAARGVGADVRVIPSRSIPQGVAALVAMNTEAGFDENVAAMTAAADAVRSGEVTLAARTTSVDGVAVRAGQPIALIDGALVLAGEDVGAVAYACARRMLEGRAGALVTLYAGDGVDAAAAAALAERLREEAGCDVEAVEGGQPHYAYLIGVE